MPDMKKDRLSCRACALNRYEEFHARHEKRTKRHAGHISSVYNNFMRIMILRNPKTDLLRALKYCALV